jgi:sulfatase modifying factor 1
VPALMLRNPIDGTEMVLVPGGQAVLGSRPDDPDSALDRKPQSEPHVPAYYMGIHAVTNAQYLRFVEATGHAPPRKPAVGRPVWHNGVLPAEKADHPVVCVTWADAQAYCRWAGLRLPTEPEWEKGARGTDGRIFPWGDEWDPTRCRHAGNRRRGSTCSVWDYPSGVSVWGLYNIAGNTWEWCDGNEDGSAPSPLPPGQPVSPAGVPRAVKGGSWQNSAARSFRCAIGGRIGPGTVSLAHGFRCARDA